MDTAERARHLAALRASKRQLSGVRTPTMAERLATLAARPDLDQPGDTYGDGGPVTALEERVAELLGTEAAVFFPTGTMAQQVALRYGAERTGSTAVAMHPLSHFVMHEEHAYAELAGLRAIWPTSAPRNPTADEITGLSERVGTVTFELPLRDAGFVLPTWDELVAAAGAARAAGARVHLDGARIWESTPYLGRSLPEVAALADSVYVSFYKSLGGISGAALAGPAALAAFARTWRHRYGGALFQHWPAALAALHGLDTTLPRLASCVAHARTVAAALAALPGARVHPDPPHTHQFQLWLPHPVEALRAALLAQAEEDGDWFASGWYPTSAPGLSMTEITVAAPALELDAAAVTELGTRFLDRVTERATERVVS
jgi:threonine aldolase